MNRIYPTRINWENEPSVATPLGATNLNKMDLAVYTIDGRLVTMDAEKLSNSTAGQMIVGVAYEQSTGVITFTRFDGATSTIDLPIEMIPAEFSYDATTKEFVITLKSGEEIRVSVADLVDTYIFDNSDTILANQTTSTDGKHISLTIRNHSIGDEQMQQGYLADITDNATRAKASEDNAKVSEDNAKASELLALQYKNEAFSGTPEGYEALVGKVAENSEGLKILNSEYATSLELDTAEGGLGVNSIKGQTVKDSTGLISAGENGVLSISSYYADKSDKEVGVCVDFQNNTFTRIGDALGKNEGVDFNEIFAFGGRRRCNVSDNGTITAFYGENGYKEDGSNGQVMIYQPSFYYKVEALTKEPVSGGKGYHLRKANYWISDKPKDGYKLHPAFRDNKDRFVPYILLSAYEGSAYDVSANAYNLNDTQNVDFNADKLSSIANAKPISGLTQNFTRANARKVASNRGSGWYISTIASVSASQILFLVEYASFNMQTKIGSGITTKASGSGNEAELTGLTSSLGNASGVGTNNALSYRGEENPFGNIYKWVDGINIYNYDEGTVYVANHDFADNTNEGAYKDCGITISGSNGYVSAFAYNENSDWLFIPSECDGNANLPVGDYFYQSKPSNQYTGALLGGVWYDGTLAGVFDWYMGRISSYYARNIGTRILYVPSNDNKNYTKHKWSSANIPLSAPINRNNGVYDEITKQNGKWGVLRKFGRVDLGTLSWSKPDVSLFTADISNKALSQVGLLCSKYNYDGAKGFFASDKTITDWTSPESYRTKICIKDTDYNEVSAFKSAMNGEILIYELATPYFEPFDDQSVMYQLESYDTKTYVTTGEGLAELSVRYGKSDVAAEALRKIVITPSEIADLVRKELIALGIIVAPQAEVAPQALNEENVE